MSAPAVLATGAGSGIALATTIHRSLRASRTVAAVHTPDDVGAIRNVAAAAGADAGVVAFDVPLIGWHRASTAALEAAGEARRLEVAVLGIDVAQVVARALTDARPRPLSRVGFAGPVLRSLRTLLPALLRQRAVRRAAAVGSRS